MGLLDSLKSKYREWDLVFERAAFDFGYYALIFMTVGAVGLLINGFFLSNDIGYFISSYIFFLVGLAIYYRRHPVGALIGFLLFLFAGVVTLAIFYQKNFDILTAGITGILVIITGWYAKNMHTQIVIMNNEKLGKLIAELSRSIFSPMYDDLIKIKKEFETNFFIEQILPTKFTFYNKKRNILQNYLEGEIDVIVRGQIFKSSSRRLLNINDKDLAFAILRLKKIDVEYKENLDDLSTLFKQFDDDFLPYFQEFKSKCIDLSNSSNMRIAAEENYFKLILKFSIMNQIASCENVGVNFECYAHLCEFINKHSNELNLWIQNILVLKTDLQNIQNKKVDVVCSIDKMIKEVNILHKIWKTTYYLTEAEMHC
jgi:hypothetical protein